MKLTVRKTVIAPIMNCFHFLHRSFETYSTAVVKTAVKESIRIGGFVFAF